MSLDVDEPSLACLLMFHVVSVSMLAHDLGAAPAATAACVAAKRVLDDAVARLDASRMAAIEDWVGPHRRAYNETWARLRGCAEDVGSTLVTAHGLLVAADEEARAALLRPGPS